MGVAVATAVIIIAVTAMLVTGYMSAFKPGENQTTNSTGYAGGGRSGGVTATVASPSPTPMPTPPGLGEIPSPEEMPVEEMQTAAVPKPVEQPELQSPSGYYTGPPQQSEISCPSPTVAPAPARTPEFTGKLPFSAIGGQWGSWFNIAPPSKATPEPIQPPRETAPGQRQPLVGSENPAFPTLGQTPYETGWSLIIQRLLEAIPLLFPGYYPGFQWFAVPSTR